MATTKREEKIRRQVADFEQEFKERSAQMEPLGVNRNYYSPGVSPLGGVAIEKPEGKKP